MALLKKKKSEKKEAEVETPISTDPEELKKRAKAQVEAKAAELEAETKKEVVEEAEEAEVVNKCAEGVEAKEEASVPAVRSTAGLPGKTISATDLMKEMLYSGLENGFVVEFGTLPRLLASNGCIMDGEDNSLGTWITGQVLSWNKRWTITPGSNDAPDNLVAFSMDNEVLDDGSGVTVAQYLAELKKDWPNAASKEYLDVIFNLQEAEKESGHVGGMVQLQMSPTSRKDFDAFRLQVSFKVANGLVEIDQTNHIKFGIRVVTNKNKNTWTKFAPSLLV